MLAHPGRVERIPGREICSGLVRVLRRKRRILGDDAVARKIQAGPDMPRRGLLVRLESLDHTENGDEPPVRLDRAVSTERREIHDNVVLPEPRSEVPTSAYRRDGGVDSLEVRCPTTRGIRIGRVMESLGGRRSLGISGERAIGHEVDGHGFPICWSCPARHPGAPTARRTKLVRARSSLGAWRHRQFTAIPIGVLSRELASHEDGFATLALPGRRPSPWSPEAALAGAVRDELRASPSRESGLGHRSRSAAVPARCRLPAAPARLRSGR